MKNDYCLLTKQLQTAINIAGTLEATDYKEPQTICYTVDCRNGNLNYEKSGTLQAKDLGGWSVNVTNPVLVRLSDE